MAFSALRGASSGLIAALKKGPRLRRRKPGRSPQHGTSAQGADAPASGKANTIASLAPLTEIISEYLAPKEVERVKEAYRFSDQAHLGQFRASGEPYISQIGRAHV